MVFMAPFLSSKKYADALDIVMADPYPVPDHPIELTGEVASQLKSEYTGKKTCMDGTCSHSAEVNGGDASQPCRR